MFNITLQFLGWTALKFTKPVASKTTQSLNHPGLDTANTMADKEALVRAVHFPKQLLVRDGELKIGAGIAHQNVNQNTVRRILFEKSIHKAANLN